MGGAAFAALRASMTIPLILIALAPAAPASASLPSPPPSFLASPAPAGRAPLIPLDAAPIGEARQMLGRGRPEVALKRLAPLREGRLADRAALVAGDAHLALNEPEAALTAYAAAVERAQTTGVRRAGARGVIASLGRLDQPAARRAWIEGLRRLEPGSSDLRLALAEALLALGEPAAADAQLRALLVEAPTSSLAEPARDLRRRVPPPDRAAFTDAELRQRFRAELDAGATTAARATLDQISASERERNRLRWELTRATGDRAKEAAQLDALLADQPDPELALRRARLHLAADAADAAVAGFDAVAKRFPKSAEAMEAAFLAGWTRYDEGALAEAEQRMRAFAARYPGRAKVTEALWYAGWTAYLDGREAAARDAWAQLLKRHPRSDLVPAAHYWTGRAHAGADRDDEAAEAYARAVAAAPLSYYAFWARQRLRALGRPAAQPPRPDGLEAFELRQILVELGPRRPISVDRAVALHAAGLDDAVDDEIRELVRAWPKAEGLRQVVLRTDLLVLLGAHARAFRYAWDHRPSAERVAAGDFWAWRAYRHVFPRAFQSSVVAAERAHGVDPQLLWSIMRTESHYRADALSPAGARGLMQVLPATARRIGRQEPRARPHAARLLEPHSNVWLGAWYLDQLQARYDGYRPALIGAYNAGPPAMQRWLRELDGRPTDEFVERISYRETRRYVRRVLETQWTYELLYGRDPSPVAETAQNRRPPSGAVAF